MKTIIHADDVVTFPLNSTLERYLLDEEFLVLLNNANVPLTVIGNVVSVPAILMDQLKVLYKHVHGRDL